MCSKKNVTDFDYRSSKRSDFEIFVERMWKNNCLERKGFGLTPLTFDEHKQKNENFLIKEYKNSERAQRTISFANSISSVPGHQFFSIIGDHYMTDLHKIIQDLSKGSDPRPMNIDRKTFEENFDKIFKQKKGEKNEQEITQKNKK